MSKQEYEYDFVVEANDGGGGGLIPREDGRHVREQSRIWRDELAARGCGGAVMFRRRPVGPWEVVEREELPVREGYSPPPAAPKPPPPSKFSPGDVVRTKAGVPMTVERNGDHYVRCVWFEGETVRRGDLAEDRLELVTATEGEVIIPVRLALVPAASSPENVVFYYEKGELRRFTMGDAVRPVFGGPELIVGTDVAARAETLTDELLIECYFATDDDVRRIDIPLGLLMPATEDEPARADADPPG